MIKPLESRNWFVVLGLAISLALMGSLWVACGLPVSTAAGAPFVFAVLGFWVPVRLFLALALVRFHPALGDVG